MHQTGTILVPARTIMDDMLAHSTAPRPYAAAGADSHHRQ